MDNLRQLFKKDEVGQLILCILFIIYLIMGYKTPEPVASMIDSMLGKIIILLIIILLFIHANPILAVLSLFVAFDLMRRSSSVTGIDALKNYLPTEAKKSSQFTAFNQYPYTLEQEVVKKMAPIVQSGSSLTKASYMPMLENLHDASTIN
jgi:hypothetical protein